MTLTVAEVLEKAASLIEPEGAWTQGGWTNRNAVLRAIDRAAFDFRSRESARKFLRKAIGTRAIARWNDALGRTQAEVVAKLREAAAKARGEA